MIFALLAALLVQTDPRIESVERLVGHVQRPYLWAPLAVTIKSAAGFKGDLVAQSSMGVRVAREIRVPANGSERVLLPAIDPQKIIAGNATLDVPKDLKVPDFVVLVDSRLPYANELPSSDKILYHKIEPADLEKLLAQGLLDACDLLLLKDAAGLSVGSVRAWAVAPSTLDAKRAVTEKLKPREPVSLVESGVDGLWTLAPQGGWVPAKKDRAVLFAAMYALAGFLVLVFAGRGRAKWAPAAVTGVAALGVVSFLLFFPRKHLWISERSCEIVPVEGEAMGVRLWFVGAAADLSPRLDFPRVVKPVFSRQGDTDEPLTIRVREQGCSAEGFTLRAGRSLCFAGLEGRAPTMRATERAARPLYGAAVRIGGSERGLGDLAVGSAVPRETSGGGPPPRDLGERAWLRFLDGDGVYGRLDRGTRIAEDVGSPDLADGRQQPTFFIQRFR